MFGIDNDDSGCGMALMLYGGAAILAIAFVGLITFIISII